MFDSIQGRASPIIDKTVSSKPIKRQVDSAFLDILETAAKSAGEPESLKISNHAQKRLEQQGLKLNDVDMHHLKQAVKTLEEKGSRQSLILYDDLALIASIKNRTVITALKSDEMNEVTDIDSAFQINEKR